MTHSTLFNRNFTMMSVGQFISLFGNTLQRFALSLYILEQTGSATIFSSLLALTILPQIFIAPFGGALADRLSKRNIMVVLDTLSGIILLVFALLLKNTTAHSVVLVGALMVVLALIQSVYDPAVRAAIPAITLKDNLTQANSVVSLISSMSSLVGPIAAGFLYGILGLEAIFAVNIVSFFASAILELFLVIPRVLNSGAPTTSYLKDITSSFSYLTHEKPAIFQMILMAGCFNLVLTPIYTVGVPYVEKLIFHVTSSMYGISEGFFGLGMIVGALVTAQLSKRWPLKRLSVYFYALMVLTLAMGITTLPQVMGSGDMSTLSYLLFTAFGFLFALVLAAVNILCMTYMQSEIPMAYMGKVMALAMAISTAFMPLGQIVFGTLYDVFSGNLILVYALVALATALLSRWTAHLLKTIHL